MRTDNPGGGEQTLAGGREGFSPVEAPFLHSTEGARTVFVVTAAAACAPLVAGILLFGWRSAVVAVLSVASCALLERIYFRVTRTPALLGRSHAYLTGLLLALTLPAFVPWYVPVVGAAFAVIVGKAVFGGVGHFLWHPALVGRLAVAVIFGPAASLLPSAMTFDARFPDYAPVLAQKHLLIGDVTDAGRVEGYRQWRGARAPRQRDALLLLPPSVTLGRLTNPSPAAETSLPDPAYSALAVPADRPHARPAALMQLPPVTDLLYGVRPGGIGETCAIVIVLAGLYLVYRNYVRWQLPVAMIASACAVAAVAPVMLSGPNDTVEMVWLPLLSEGLDVGFTYVNYQVLSGELLLTAFFLAPEMTSRPVTHGGQVLFGVGCGVIAMLLTLYMNIRIPSYMAVLAMNTLTPMIDAMWRPRVFGRKRFAFLRRKKAE